MSPNFIKWAGRQLKPFLDRREAHQRQKRFEAMLRANPELRARAELHSRMQAGHKPSRAAWKALRDATAAELRREVHHG